MTRISDVTRALERWAPRDSQQSYDNVGLQVGDAHAALSRCLIALDLTPDVIEEAIEQQAQLIITHHPLIFRPLKGVTQQDWHGALIHTLIAHNIGLYCIHTNLDAAHQGVSFALAAQLGLENVQFLRPTKGALLKLVTFVPEANLAPVRAALAEAGAGHIGDYEGCAFASEGTGYFTPGMQSNPTIGSAGGQEESVREVRLEVEVHRWSLPNILKALHTAHPYEEVAYDVYPVEKQDTRTGMGAIGTLPAPESLSEVLARISGALQTPALHFTGDLASTIRTVAVCGGSGSDLIHDALRAGADAYLTADVTYHRFFDVLDTKGIPRMALINAGHYETEACTEDLLQSWLHARFPAVQCLKTATKTTPVQTFIAPASP